MNIVIAGSRVQIFGEDVQTYKELPVGSYEVCFNPMSGFWLTPRQDLEAKEEKIYGNHQEKVQKVLSSFQLTDRNFGVILSGQKGIGKSLFARILAEQCIENEIPVITVSSYIPGIADFLGSIDQSVAVIFDEFEKTFGKMEENDPQEEMLSLFDGMDNGKKLFVITCNEVNKLNDYLLNRPGRFHYHFTISNPTDTEVSEYMMDKLKPEYHDVIEKIVHFSKTINMTYDFLRALAFELNQGYSLEDTLADLNITRTNDIRFNITLTFTNGQTYNMYDRAIDLYGDKKDRVRLYGESDYIYLSYDPKSVIIEGDQLIIPPHAVKFTIDEDDYWNIDNEADRKMAIERAKNRTVQSCVFIKQNKDFVSRYMI